MDAGLAAEVRRLYDTAWRHSADWDASMSTAETLLRAHLEQDPDCVDALTSLGAVLSDQGKHKEAVDVLSRARSLGSDDGNTYYNLAAALMNVNASGRGRARSHFARADKLVAKPTTLRAYVDPHGH